MNDTPTLVVCDAGPLIHLDELECLDLLADFSRVVVPDAVWLEVQRHRPTALNESSVQFERLMPVGGPVAQLTSLQRLLTLHTGEAQALQLAYELGADLLLTDDTAARLAAQSLRLEAHGTLGILLRARRRNQRKSEEVVRLLQTLPVRSTLHIKRELLSEIIQQVKEVDKRS